MKTQEIRFKCRNCGVVVSYLQPDCSGCGFIIEWEETVEKEFDNKYLEILTVRV